MHQINRHPVRAHWMQCISGTLFLIMLNSFDGILALASVRDFEISAIRFPVRRITYVQTFRWLIPSYYPRTSASRSNAMEYQTRELETPTLGVALPSAFPVGLLGKYVEATDVGNVGKIPLEPASLSTT